MLPVPMFTSPVEPFISADESVCERAERPGVHAFIDFVLSHVGGKKGRTLNDACVARSGHNSGRAWDWMISAKDPEQRAKADALINWLLANDAELFRRAGLAYIIWDRKIFSAGKPYWHPYDGFDEEGNCASPPCRNPHTDHVHFSWHPAGAEGQTSFYDWLNGGMPKQPAKPVDTSPPFIAWAAGLFGFGLGFAAMRYRQRRP